MSLWWNMAVFVLILVKKIRTKAHDQVIKDSFEQINQEYKKELGALLTLNFQIAKELNVSQKF